MIALRAVLIELEQICSTEHVRQVPAEDSHLDEHSETKTLVVRNGRVLIFRTRRSRPPVGDVRCSVAAYCLRTPQDVGTKKTHARLEAALF